MELQSCFGRVMPGLADVGEYQQRKDPRRWLAVFGQAYMIFARKRIVPATPVRQRWSRLPKLGPAVIPEARIQLRKKQART